MILKFEIDYRVREAFKNAATMTGMMLFACLTIGGTAAVLLSVANAYIHPIYIVLVPILLGTFFFVMEYHRW